MEYGKTSDSKTEADVGGSQPNVVAWKVNKIADKHGNYMLIKYKRFKFSKNSVWYDSQVIDEITYTHNDNVSGAVINSLKFEYKVRDDVNSGYIHGTQHYTQGYLLKSISSYSGSTLFGKLNLEYAYDQNSTLLVSINKENGVGGLLNDTKFKYNTFSTNLETNTINPDYSANENQKFRRYADFNGDGYTDYLTSITDFITPPNGGSAHWIKKHEIFLNNKDFTFSKVKEIGNLYEDEKKTKYLQRPKSTFNLVFDIDGDNKQDILNFKMNPQNLEIEEYYIYKHSLNASGQFQQTTKQMKYPTNPQTYFPSYAPYTQQNYNVAHSKWSIHKSDGNWLIPGDYDGDGKTEILIFVDVKYQEVWTPGGQPSGNFAPNLVHTKNYSKDNIAMFLDPNASSYNEASVPILINTADMATPVDMDGDGKQEILVAEVGTSDLKLYELSNNGFALLRTFTAPSNIVFRAGVEFGDFNGDKKTDILSYDTEFSLGPSGLKYQTNNAYFIAYSNGNTFEVKNNLDIPNVTVDFANGEIAKREYTVADFNFDGKSDILEMIDIGKYVSGGGGIDQGRNYWVSESQVLRTFYSNGLAFNCHTNPIVGSNYFRELELDPYQFYDKHVKLADINGDGFVDICHATRKYHFHVNTRGYDYNTVLITNPNSGSSKLLSGIKNGYNNEIEINYNRLNNPLNSVQDNIPSYVPTIPYRVVSSYLIPDGIGGKITHTYKYGSPKYLPTRGFIGFEGVLHRTSQLNAYDLTSNAFNSNYQELFTFYKLNGITRNGIDERLADETYDIEFMNYSQTSTGAGSKRYIDLLKKITKFNYKTGVESKTDYTYDTKANEYKILSSESVVNTNDNLLIKSTSYLNYIAAGSSLANKPQKIIKTITRKGKPSITDITEYKYLSSTGEIEYEVINKGKPCETKISYEYDLAGNIWKTTELPTGSLASTNTIAREKRLEYDQSKRFVEKEYNTMNQLVNSTLYNSISGVPEQSTDINGEVTVYEYDDWNKLKKSRVLGRNIENNISFHWGPYLFYKREIGTKSPEVISHYDALGRLISKESVGRFNKPTRHDIVYDKHSQKVYETNDYYLSESPFETTTDYDDYGRVKSVTNPNGTTDMSYSYSITFGHSIITVTNPQGQVKTTHIDASQKKIKVEDIYGKTILNDFNSAGQLINTQIDGVKNIEYFYNTCGQLEKQVDISNGALDYTYDEWGQVKSKKNARNKIESYDYDQYGRKVKRTNPEGITTYTYVPFSQNGRNQIQKIYINATNSKDNVLENFSYDNRGNMTYHSKDIGGIKMGVSYIYDTKFNIIESKWYSSGVRLDYHYDTYNMLESITSGSRLIYELKNTNSFDQPTEYILGNGLTTNNTYDQNYPVTSSTQTFAMGWGLPTSLLDYSVAIDKPSGNVTSRSFYSTNLFPVPSSVGITENFTYDSKDRLEGSEINGNYLNIKYDQQELGNIEEKDDVGFYDYDNMNKNRVVQITDPTNAISPITQLVDYTSFEQPSILWEGQNRLFIAYGADQQRIRGVWYQQQPNQTPPSTNNFVCNRIRYYFGDMEINVEKQPNSNTYYADYIHYVNGIDGQMVAIVKNRVNNFDVNSALNSETQDIDQGGITIGSGTTLRNPDEYYFTYTDHLGSILVVTDDVGVVVSRRNFDAWGRYRNPSSGAFVTSTGSPSWLYRGYTGHEHLDEFVLINMNGRLYDPVVSRFLSTDLYINDPENSNTYNRYTYALNNPLKYTDPSGEEITLIGAIAIGAVIGGSSYSLGVLISGGEFNTGEFLKSVAIGAISGAVSFGVGNVITGTYGVKFTMSKMLASATAHTSTSVAMGLVRTQLFNEPMMGAGGLLTNFVSSAASGAMAGLAPFGKKVIGDIGNSAVSGGVAAASAWVQGNDPIRAFAHSAIISLANHAAHKFADRITVKSKIKGFWREVESLSDCKNDCVPAQVAAILLSKGIRKTTSQLVDECYGPGSSTHFKGVKQTQMADFFDWFGLKSDYLGKALQGGYDSDRSDMLDQIRDGNFVVVATYFGGYASSNSHALGLVEASGTVGSSLPWKTDVSLLWFDSNNSNHLIERNIMMLDHIYFLEFK